MTDVIIVAGNEPELIKLADSLNKLFCDNKATACLYNDIKHPAGAVKKVFIVGHANINSIGDYDVSSVGQLLSGFTIDKNTSIYLAGCSTGDANQQVMGGKGFFPGLPLVDKLKSLHPKAALYYTRSTLFRKADGTLYLQNSPNQGIMNVTGKDVFAHK